MEKDKESITLGTSDEESSLSSVGHIIIHEDPRSPDESTADEPKNDDSDTGTNSSAYDGDTIIDSPTSSSSTLILNSSQYSSDINDMSQRRGYSTGSSSSSSISAYYMEF